VCSITDALSIVGDRYALLVLKEWGDRHCNLGAEPIVFQHTCGADFHPLTVCAACREPLRDGELTVTGGTHPVQATM
jgi:hypothetical protein